jgi:hypothetical protein
VSQKSFRSGDIDDIGDNRHTTFFEMLGNWSLGDYFKEEQLNWFFDFLTTEVGIDANHLYVTVFAGDENAGVPRDTESVRRFPCGCGSPRRNGTRGCIPLPVKSVVGSFSGTREALGITACPLFSKYSKYFFLTSFVLMRLILQ